jgi:hypothetical protein
MYLRHTERREEVSERRGRGFEEEGDEILKAGDERREGGESKIVTVQDAPGVEERIGQPRRLLE